MDNKVFSYGKWICAEPFAKLEPVDLLHKQSDEKEIELPDDLKNIHMLVRKKFNILTSHGKVAIRITADDYYKLYINGNFIGQGPAQGYYFCYYWNEFDITNYINDGENEIFIDVYYQGLINRAYNSGDRRIGMIAEIFDDDNCILSTNSDWECAISKAYSITHTIGYDTIFAENFDSRFQVSQWDKCRIKDYDYTFSSKPAIPLQVYRKKPVSSENVANGGILYDFGEEITAALSITAVGKSGDKIRILCGEELEDTPLKIRYDMRCCCLCEEFWTLKDGKCHYEQYEYKGFRYVAIIPENGATIQSLEAIVRHYPFDDGYCNLKTDSEVLHSVWQICKNSVKYGSQEVYVDCPTREKGQYSGDMLITGSAQVLLTGDTTLFKKSLDNLMQSAKICPGLMAVAPGSLMQEIADYSLIFPVMALFYYKHTKDKEYLNDTLKVCENIIRHFCKFDRGDGLLEEVNDKWNLVDWPENFRDGYDFPLTQPIGKGCHNVINAFYIGCVKETETIKRILGIKSDIQVSKLIKAFNDEFFNEKTGLYVDQKGSTHSAIHSNIIPLFFGIHKQEYEEEISNYLINCGMKCGVYMAYFLLKSLCKIGKYEEAYSLIVSESEHSWYNMVCEGATTCFEAWGKDQKWNTSLCHPWASAPISILIEDIIPNKPYIAQINYRKKDSYYEKIRH